MCVIGCVCVFPDVYYVLCVSVRVDMSALSDISLTPMQLVSERTPLLICNTTFGMEEGRLRLCLA